MMPEREGFCLRRVDDVTEPCSIAALPQLRDLLFPLMSFAGFKMAQSSQPGLHAKHRAANVDARLP